MWLAGALGVACGSGYYSIAGIATVFAILVLVVLARLEDKINLPSKDDHDPPAS
jgi:putative Mg2+ transporter-C (MgtC) family protein